LDELKARRSRVEVRGQMQRQQEGYERGCEGSPGGKFAAVGQQQNKQRACEGSEENQRDDDVIHF